MTSVANVTQKGLILIPVDFRNRYGLKPFSQALIEETEKGLLIKPAPTVKSMQGFLKTKKRLTDAQLEEAIANYDYS